MLDSGQTKVIIKDTFIHIKYGAVATSQDNILSWEQYYCIIKVVFEYPNPQLFTYYLLQV